MTREEAIRFRDHINEILEALDDEAALNVPDLFLPWKPGINYYGPPATEDAPAQSRVQHGETLYKCLQSHTSQIGWEPDIAVSLWVKMDNPAEEWPEWIQPVGAQDAYEYGAQVSHNDKHWISTYEGANVWEPGVYGWDEVIEE